MLLDKTSHRGVGDVVANLELLPSGPIHVSVGMEEIVLLDKDVELPHCSRLHLVMVAPLLDGVHGACVWLLQKYLGVGKCSSYGVPKNMHRAPLQLGLRQSLERPKELP